MLPSVLDSSNVLRVRFRDFGGSSSSSVIIIRPRSSTLKELPSSSSSSSSERSARFVFPLGLVATENETVKEVCKQDAPVPKREELKGYRQHVAHIEGL